MGSWRFTNLQIHPMEVLDLTGLTLDEFQQLVLPFEAAFQAHMAYWRLDRQPRTARRYATDTNCSLPTPEERLLFILVYLQTYPLQVVQGRRFGMGKAHRWAHILLVVLQATLRSLTELAKRLGIAKADAPVTVVPTEGAPPTSDLPMAGPTPPPASPFRQCAAARRRAHDSLAQ